MSSGGRFIIFDLKIQRCLTCKLGRLSFQFLNLIALTLYRAYDLQLSDAMNDLQEQVKVEHAPTDKNEHGMEVSYF